jgi:AbrB family looped-hinge helix DNA binding protein
MARYAQSQPCFQVRVDARGPITIPKPARDELGWRSGDEIVVRVEGGVAILTKRGVPDGDDLEEILEGLAGVRARLRGEGLDAVAVVREGRRELERRSWAALGRWDAALARTSDRRVLAGAARRPGSGRRGAGAAAAGRGVRPSPRGGELDPARLRPRPP